MTITVIVFLIGIAVYIVGLITYVIIKHIRYKRKFNKELEAKKHEEEQNNTINSKI